MSGVFDAGRVAVITGGAGGIGLAVAQACGRRGMRVAVADVNPNVLEEACKQLLAEFSEGYVFAVPCNVADEQSMVELKDAVYERWGEVSFLHLNAGVIGGTPGGLGSSKRDWERNLGVNLYGVVHGLQAFVPRMKAQGNACAVVATASWAGLFNAGTFSGMPYVVSKAGAVLLMEGLQHELRSEAGCQVTAHVLCPGRVGTNMLMGRDEDRVSQVMPVKATSPEEKAHQEARLLKFERALIQDSMSPATMASILLKAVENGQFYVLGYDGQQPLNWLKMFVQLRCEDIVQGNPPVSHLLPGSDGRRRLREIKRSSEEKRESKL